MPRTLPLATHWQKHQNQVKGGEAALWMHLVKPPSATLARLAQVLGKFCQAIWWVGVRELLGHQICRETDTHREHSAFSDRLNI